MTHSNSTSHGADRDNHADAHASAYTNGEGTMPLDGELNVFLDQAQVWIKENRTLAMLGGFGLGVFIGVLLRR